MALRLAPTSPGLPRSHKTTWQHATGPGPRRCPQHLAMDDAADSAFPIERQGRPPHDRSISGLLLSLALRPATSLFTLQGSCSRPPASGQSVCPAKRGSRRLARLCRGGHSRPLGFVRLAAHPLTEPYVNVSIHTALGRASDLRSSDQWANSDGWARRMRASFRSAARWESRYLQHTHLTSRD